MARRVLRAARPSGAPNASALPDVECLCFLQAARTRRNIIESDNKKLQRRIEHSKPGSIVVKPDRKKKIIAVEE
jgi:hypothetical protein